MLTGFMAINSTYNGLDADVSLIIVLFPTAIINLGVYYLPMCNEINLLVLGTHQYTGSGLGERLLIKWKDYLNISVCVSSHSVYNNYQKPSFY